MPNTPSWNIPYPDSSTLAADLPARFKDMAVGFDTALTTAALKPVTNPQHVVAASAAARDAYWGTPATEQARLALQAKGAITTRTDTGCVERYFATYNAISNPAGTTPAGWYPVSGALPFGQVLRAPVPVTIRYGQYDNISSSSYWAPARLQGGMSAFASGWKPPIAGDYRIEAELLTAGTGPVALLTGFTTGATAPARPTDLLGGQTQYALQGFVLANPGLTRRLTPSDTIRLWGYSQAAATELQTTPAAGMSISLRYIGPPVGA